MQIDFQALEQALAPIEEIGQAELTFDAGPTTITLRVLRPAEEVEAQKYAAAVLNDDEGDHQAVDYLDKLRIGFLSYSVVAIGDMDFRDVEYVETGEVLDNGTKVKIPKPKAMRQLLCRWSRPILTVVFSQFHALTAKAEQEAERQIEYEPSNVPAEIDRLNKRIEELRDQMEQAEAAEKTKLSERLNAVDQALDEPPERPQRPAPAPKDEVKVNPEQVMPAAQRQPAHRTWPITPATIQGVPEDIEPPPVRRPQGQQPSPQAKPPRADTSFVNADDEDSLHAAADAEHARLLERRRRMAQNLPPTNADGSAMTAAGLHSGAPTPPHADAAAVAARMEAQRAGHGRPVGTLDGKEVYRMPGQELGAPPPQRTEDPRSVVNPQAKPDGGSLNPRFQPPKKP